MGNACCPDAAATAKKTPPAIVEDLSGDDNDEHVRLVDGSDAVITASALFCMEASEHMRAQARDTAESLQRAGFRNAVLRWYSDGTRSTAFAFETDNGALISEAEATRRIAGSNEFGWMLPQVYYDSDRLTERPRAFVVVKRKRYVPPLPTTRSC